MLLDYFDTTKDAGPLRCGMAIAILQVLEDDPNLFRAVDEWQWISPRTGAMSAARAAAILEARGYPIGSQTVSTHRSALTNRAGRFCACRAERLYHAYAGVIAEHLDDEGYLEKLRPWFETEAGKATVAILRESGVEL